MAYLPHHPCYNGWDMAENRGRQEISIALSRSQCREDKKEIHYMSGITPNSPVLRIMEFRDIVIMTLPAGLAGLKDRWGYFTNSYYKDVERLVEAI